MQENMKKSHLRAWQIVIMTILSPIIIVGGHWMLVRADPSMFDTMPVFMWVLVIVSFDIGWFFLMAKTSLIGRKLKIIVVWLVAAISASLLLHMFGRWVMSAF